MNWLTQLLYKKQNKTLTCLTFSPWNYQSVIFSLNPVFNIHVLITWQDWNSGSFAGNLKQASACRLPHTKLLGCIEYQGINQAWRRRWTVQPPLQRRASKEILQLCWSSATTSRINWTFFNHFDAKKACLEPADPL